MNVVDVNFPKATGQEETPEVRAIRWRAEAISDRDSLWPWQRLRLSLGGQVRMGSEQLVPEEPDNPMMPMHVFNCPDPKCGKLGKGYKNGFPEDGRYFICNSCNLKFDAHERISAVLHLLGNFADLARFAWRLRLRRAPSRA